MNKTTVQKLYLKTPAPPFNVGEEKEKPGRDVLPSGPTLLAHQHWLGGAGGLSVNPASPVARFARDGIRAEAQGPRQNGTETRVSSQ